MNPPTPVDDGPVEAARLADVGQVLLLDVREHGEWDHSHAPQASHVPLGELDPSAVTQDRPVVAVCAAATAQVRRRRRCLPPASTSATWHAG